MLKVINEGITSVENKLRNKNSLSTSQFIQSSRAINSSGSSMSMINDMNKTQSSRGSFGFDMIKNKTQDISNNPYMT